MERRAGWVNVNVFAEGDCLRRGRVLGFEALLEISHVN